MLVEGCEINLKQFYYQREDQAAGFDRSLFIAPATCQMNSNVNCQINFDIVANNENHLSEVGFHKLETYING